MVIIIVSNRCSFFFFFSDPAPTEIYPLPLHDALPIWPRDGHRARRRRIGESGNRRWRRRGPPRRGDRKSTRLNSSHDQISYAVFCLKKKLPAPAQQPTSL